MLIIAASFCSQNKLEQKKYKDEGDFEKCEKNENKWMNKWKTREEKLNFCRCCWGVRVVTASFHELVRVTA